MLQVVDVRLDTAYRLWIRFNDGVEGVIDLAPELYGPVFLPLRDPALFSQVSVNSELRTISWPNGADFAPEFLRKLLAASAIG